MYETNHFPATIRRFTMDHGTPLHMPATAAVGTVGELTASDSAADDVPPSASASVSAPSLRLNHSELWHKFASVGTEMVITKSGRYAEAHRLKF